MHNSYVVLVTFSRIADCIGGSVLAAASAGIPALVLVAVLSWNRKYQSSLLRVRDCCFEDEKLR